MKVRISRRRIRTSRTNWTQLSLAGTMRRRGMSIEAIEAALLAVNRTQCERPGSEQNIIRIARSAEEDDDVDDDDQD
jgi:hypothetical protein